MNIIKLTSLKMKIYSKKKGFNSLGIVKEYTYEGYYLQKKAKCKIKKNLQLAFLYK